MDISEEYSITKEVIYNYLSYIYRTTFGCVPLDSTVPILLLLDYRYQF